jgi:hypothetical protein
LKIKALFTHPDTRQVAEHMMDFGLTVLVRAAYDATFSERGRPFVHALAVGQAAHGAEIVVKARIAEEHPLLVFDRLPKSTNTSGHLTLVELFQYGRTIQYQDLPERLWAATGIRMADTEAFQKFGRLRNQIIHLAVLNRELSTETLKFLFEVMEPVVQDFWDESIVPRAEEWDDVIVTDGYLREQLVKIGIAITPELDRALTTMPRR